jgi:SAM-dependent methyltransferase
MISRTLRDLFYRAMRIPMRTNGALYRSLRSPRSGLVKVHLGPGQRNYLDGWINVDANCFSAKIDVWADLRNALPFRDNTVDAFYSHHVIEHLPDYLLPFHFREMARCLKPGGLIRVGGPNGDSAARKLIEGDRRWFPDFPDPHRSVGGRFANYLLCRGEHLTILTLSYLTELAETAGFERIQRCLPIRETTRPELIGSELLSLEKERDFENPHTLIIEAIKPETASLEQQPVDVLASAPAER